MNLKQKNSILLKKKSFFKYKMAAKIDFFCIYLLNFKYFYLI